MRSPGVRPNRSEVAAEAQYVGCKHRFWCYQSCLWVIWKLCESWCVRDCPALSPTARPCLRVPSRPDRGGSASPPRRGHRESRISSRFARPSPPLRPVATQPLPAPLASDDVPSLAFSVPPWRGPEPGLALSRAFAYLPSIPSTRAGSCDRSIPFRPLPFSSVLVARSHVLLALHPAPLIRAIAASVPRRHPAVRPVASTFRVVAKCCLVPLRHRAVPLPRAVRYRHDTVSRRRCVPSGSCPGIPPMPSSRRPLRHPAVLCRHRHCFRIVTECRPAPPRHRAAMPCRAVTACPATRCPVSRPSLRAVLPAATGDPCCRRVPPRSASKRRQCGRRVPSVSDRCHIPDRRRLLLRAADLLHSAAYRWCFAFVAEQ